MRGLSEARNIHTCDALDSEMRAVNRPAAPKRICMYECYVCKYDSCWLVQFPMDQGEES